MFLMHPVFLILFPFAQWYLDSLTASDAKTPFRFESTSSSGFGDVSTSVLEMSRRLQSADVGATSDEYKMVTVVSQIGGVVVTIILGVLFAFLYKSSITDKRKPFPQPVATQHSLAGNKDWLYGTCDCFADCSYCLYGFCCSDARLADTYQMTGVGSYWTYVVACISMVVCTQIVGMLAALAGLPPNVSNVVSLVCHGALAVWLAMQRQKLRVKLGGSEGSCFKDCMCYFWCGCCTIIQDARQADVASNTRVDCCFKLVQSDPVRAAPVVGQAVTVAPQAVVVAQQGKEEAVVNEEAKATPDAV